MKRTAPLRGLLLVAAALLGAPACRSDGPDLNSAVHDLVGDIDRLLGGRSPPARHLTAIRDVHEQRSWTFRGDVPDPLGTTREAVRGLASSDYGSWGEAALVVQVLSSMADEHVASLVRVEAVDALTAMAPWTLDAELPAGRTVSEGEVLDALRTLKDARGRTDEDQALAFEVARAVDVLGAHRYEGGRAVPKDAPGDAWAREYGSRLRTARGVLLTFTGSSLEGFQTDPGVRDALDRAYVNVASSVIRLTLLEAALADPTDTVRAAAVRNIDRTRLDAAGPVLRQVLAHDTSTTVRREAATALGRRPLDESVPALVEALSDDMAEVRSAAARSLREATGELFGDDRTAWARWWQARQPAAPDGASPAPGTDAK